MEGRTTILISHDPRVVVGADRVVALEGGRIAACVTRDDPTIGFDASGDDSADGLPRSADGLVGARQ
jgi:ABC-type multidrug transport system ATPase subunit